MNERLDNLLDYLDEIEGGEQMEQGTPSYYKSRDGKDIFDIAHEWGLDMEKATAVKYIKRAGHKDPTKEIEDIEKAIQCLRREVQYLKGVMDKCH